MRELRPKPRELQPEATCMYVDHVKLQVDWENMSLNDAMMFS